MDRTPSERRLVELSESVTALVAETAWPDTEHGAAVQLLAHDVDEFCAALVAELRADRWSVVMSLHRPLQERVEHLVAAAADETFAGGLSTELMRPAVEGDPLGGRPRGGDARGVINRLVMGAGIESPLSAMLMLNKIGSSTLHPGLMMPAISLGARGTNPGNSRDDFILMTGRQLLLALQMAVLAVGLLALHEHDAWRHASATANQWLLDFEGMTVDDLTGGDPSVVTYI